MSILSLDQSLTCTGYIIARKGQPVQSGVISTQSEKKKRNIGDMNDKSRRTKFILQMLRELIADFKVKAIVCEEYSGFSQSKAAADALATSRTIVIGLGELLNIPVFYVAQMDAKQALTGNRNASKTDMMQAAHEQQPERFQQYISTKAKTGFLGVFEHVADAYGIHLAGRKLEIIKAMEMI